MPTNLDILLARWNALADELLHPAVELDAEAFAAMLSLFKELLAAGHAFDRGHVALMATLERQMIHGPEDTDADDADLLLDCDESQDDCGTGEKRFGPMELPAVYIADPSVNAKLKAAARRGRAA